MMDKEKHMSEAEKIRDKFNCTIHAEMKDGRVDIDVAGTGGAIMNIMTEIIEMLAQTTGRSYTETLKDLERNKKIKDIVKNKR